MGGDSSERALDQIKRAFKNLFKRKKKSTTSKQLQNAASRSESEAGETTVGDTSWSSRTMTYKPPTTRRDTESTPPTPPPKPSPNEDEYPEVVVHDQVSLMSREERSIPSAPSITDLRSIPSMARGPLGAMQRQQQARQNSRQNSRQNISPIEPRRQWSSTGSFTDAASTRSRDTRIYEAPSEPATRELPGDVPEVLHIPGQFQDEQDLIESEAVNDTHHSETLSPEEDTNEEDSLVVKMTRDPQDDVSVVQETEEKNWFGPESENEAPPRQSEMKVPAQANTTSPEEPDLVAPTESDSSEIVAPSTPELHRTGRAPIATDIQDDVSRDEEPMIDSATTIHNSRDYEEKIPVMSDPPAIAEHHPVPGMQATSGPLQDWLFPVA